MDVTDYGTNLTDYGMNLTDYGMAGCEGSLIPVFLTLGNTKAGQYLFNLC